MLRNDNPSATSEYYHGGGEIFADHVDQQMDVLLEVATCSTKIPIDVTLVEDSGISLIEDQEKLRQLIWKNRHLLIVKVMLHPLHDEGLYTIPVSVGLTRSHSVYGRWRSITRRICLI